MDDPAAEFTISEATSARDESDNSSGRGLRQFAPGAPRISLASVTILALVLNTWALSRVGYGNPYYAAATRSMTVSWKNFFFGSLDPGGFVTVDKPPFFLWVDALSARIFGYSSWSILLPNAVAGVAAVALLWLIVRRYFGVTAATVAGLVLALTPVCVAVNRLNLPEPILILLLVAAAGAILRSLDSRRWPAWIATAGALVGVAFNTKMLVGWMPGPAFVLALLIGAQGSWRISWRTWLPRVALLGVVTLVASISWMVVVDAWPASQRPYVGGSRDNTVRDLVLNYNGIDRVEFVDWSVSTYSPTTYLPYVIVLGPADGPGGFLVEVPGQAPVVTFGGVPGYTAPPAYVATPAPQVGPGGLIAGEPGPLRLLDASNGGQIAWFLPFACLGALAALWQWRADRRRRGQVVLWLAWVVVCGVVFSYAGGIYHAYYSSVMAPAIAALTGIGFVSTAGLVRNDRRWVAAVPLVLVLATLAVQLKVTGRFPDFYSWLRPYALVVVLAGLALLAYCIWQKRAGTAAFAVAVAGLLILPAAWSLSETANPSLNTSLPQAGPRKGAASGSFGSAELDATYDQLAAWLRSNADPDARWQLVTVSSQQSSGLIAEHGLSVMSLGGFSGSDPILTTADFADHVRSNEVRYVLASFSFPAFISPNTATEPATENMAPTDEAIVPEPTFVVASGDEAVVADGIVARVPGGSVALGGPDTTSQGAGSQTTNDKLSRGAIPIVFAVGRACTPVVDQTLPTAFRGVIYDCQGKADALLAVGRPSTGGTAR